MVPGDVDVPWTGGPHGCGVCVDQGGVIPEPGTAAAEPVDRELRRQIRRVVIRELALEARLRAANVVGGQSRLTQAEVAKLLGIGVRRVGQMEARALSKLRAALMTEMADEGELDAARDGCKQRAANARRVPAVRPGIEPISYEVRHCGKSVCRIRVEAAEATRADLVLVGGIEVRLEPVLKPGSQSGRAKRMGGAA